MKVRLLMNLQGALNGKKGEVRNIDEETGKMLIGFMLVEEFIPMPRPKRKPIIIHTRCSKELK